MLNRWPNQIVAIEETIAAIEQGKKRLCVVAPTGTGKTLMMMDLIEWAAAQRLNVVLLTNRRMLLDQTAARLQQHGIIYDILASGYKRGDPGQVTLAMTQTLLARLKRRRKYAVWRADIVIVDELHSQCGPGLKLLLQPHFDDGAVLVGYTATPLGIDIIDDLIVAGSLREGRACGSLVPALTYGPDEPDLSAIKTYSVYSQEFSETEQRSAIMRPGIFGRVFRSWHQLNPQHLPTVLFGPDVAGSLYFAEQFFSLGISSAHIDHEKIWINGVFMNNTPQTRDDLAMLSREGIVKIVCNRYIIREGIDWAWLRHGIFACMFDSLKAYLQAGGRFLRAYPGKDHAIIQDHGSCWWRHGDLNQDRQWAIGMTNRQAVELRIDSILKKREREPVRCYKCGRIRFDGAVCPQCHAARNSKSRLVIETDGTLRELYGDIFRQRRVATASDVQKKWNQVFYRMRHSGKTFKQAEGLFVKEHGEWPPHHLQNMPLQDGDWSRKINSVPRSQLKG